MRWYDAKAPNGIESDSPSGLGFMASLRTARYREEPLSRSSQFGLSHATFPNTFPINPRNSAILDTTLVVCCSPMWA